MTEFVEPVNPFPVSDTFREVTPELMHAMVETLAFLQQPAQDDIPGLLILHISNQWFLRASILGDEDYSHACVFELSALVHKLSRRAEVPFTPFDITTRCPDEECEIDHAAQVNVVNAFFAASVDGEYGQAVKAYTAYVRAQSHEHWRICRVEYAAMLAVHVAERVSLYRQNETVELPSLDD